MVDGFSLTSNRDRLAGPELASPEPRGSSLKRSRPIYILSKCPDVDACLPNISVGCVPNWKTKINAMSTPTIHALIIFFNEKEKIFFF